MNATTLWKIIANAQNCTPNQLEISGTIRTIDEISTILPGGVYTTFRTFDHCHVLSPKKHFSRLEESSRLMNHPVRLDEQTLRCALRYVIGVVCADDLRIRITLDLEETPGTIYISTEPLHTLPPVIYQHGGRAVTYPVQRAIPGAKVTSHIGIASQIRREMAGENVNEILIVNDENILLEGLSSNFFGVVNGVVRTAGEGVLPGTIRSVVLELAQELNIEIQFDGVRKTELLSLDEAFITSTSRSIVPLVQIDEITIGAGKPGQVTQTLMQAFQRWIEKELEPL